MPGRIEGDKMSVSEAELNARILQEKRLVALEVQTEAWADGISEGIEPEIMASAGMETILSNLMQECGPESVLNLIASMKTRFDSGAFHTHAFMN
jgi:hypothetical protein